LKYHNVLTLSIDRDVGLQLRKAMQSTTIDRCAIIRLPAIIFHAVKETRFKPNVSSN